VLIINVMGACKSSREKKIGNTTPYETEIIRLKLKSRSKTKSFMLDYPLSPVVDNCQQLQCFPNVHNKNCIAREEERTNWRSQTIDTKKLSAAETNKVNSLLTCKNRTPGSDYENPF